MSLITISSRMGSGGPEIAKRVAEGLKLELFDDQRLQQEAIQMGIRSEQLKSLDEKAPGLLDRLLGSTPELYHDVLGTVIYEVARKGEGVILGHGSQVLLRDFGCALHVLILAPEASRVNRVMKEQRLSREAAEKMIQRSDNTLRGFFRSTFHTHWNNPSLYDLILNTHKLGVDLAVNQIIQVAGSDVIKECSIAALDLMEKLSLTRRIEAELFKHNFAMIQLHVEVPEKGVAHITGLTESEENQKQIKQVVQNTPGISKVVYEVTVIPAYGL